eukprot:CAMPEP_0115090164 /NCGR_PEP_ID=MMETSP0227-20121206/25230_1 /TAXON_ID=89957 /ORGANISM="Polarella glacialis, Strain CCMP 1383" /LENGTH=325 /DNA_ID=CAMNT_0002481185 /DNA_START=102 /DNA_END=1079 /DNA_ORIENTATION=+
MAGKTKKAVVKKGQKSAPMKKVVEKKQTKKAQAKTERKSERDAKKGPGKKEEEPKKDEKDDEDEDEEESEGEEDAQDDSKKGQRKTKANRFQEESTQAEKSEPKGVIYLGHIPNGFFEPQMQQYFSQFGQVTRMRLSRSKRTGGSKGYAYIEFKEESVAKIVAQTMNKYLLFEKSLVCEYVPKEKRHAKLFKGCRTVVEDKRGKRLEKERQVVNDRPTVEVSGKAVPQITQEQVSRRKGHDKKLKALLQSLDIDYDFDGVTDKVGSESAKKESKADASKGKKNPKVSPKMSPKISPKISPKRSPAVAPAAKASVAKKNGLKKKAR